LEIKKETNSLLRGRNDLSVVLRLGRSTAITESHHFTDGLDTLLWSQRPQNLTASFKILCLRVRGDDFLKVQKDL
jgi:hypothetical protein